MKRLAGLAMGVVLAMSNASLALAAEPVSVYAAGSLRAAFTDIGLAFEHETGTPVAFVFGASGLLKDRILAGAPAQVFASANTGHPKALAQADVAGPPVVFARNQLCAVTRPEIDTSPERLLATMLDPGVKLGTSTPKADPSGDYAWELFQKADSIQPGSFDKLSAKALQLTGGPGTTSPPTGGNVYAMLLDSGKADVFLTYCTNAALVLNESPRVRMVELPPALSVGAEYGVTLIRSAPPAARQFFEFLTGAEGQAVLHRYGFR